MSQLKAKQLHTISIVVNGRSVSMSCQSNMTLLDFLRADLSLTGTHAGCEHGVCGACSVLVDGSAARSCLGFACQFDGTEIVTVEGLSDSSELSDLQLAFSRHHALQCGFCTPGFLIVAEDLLKRRPLPSVDEIRHEISSNLCRCTGYVGIVEAIHEVSIIRSKKIPGETSV
jgi:aerobic-type carbon monoxide dehydrogenase small subunit (CoxS/CutS family)